MITHFILGMMTGVLFCTFAYIVIKWEANFKDKKEKQL